MRILDRNRRTAAIARKATWKWDKATIHSIDGDRVNIRLGKSPNLIRHVEVMGDITQLVPASETPIIWKNNRPMVVAQASPVEVQKSAVGASASGLIAARVQRSTNQTATGNANTLLPITFDVPIFDTAGMWDSADPTKLTIPESGFYMISASVQTGTGSTAMVSVTIRLNGDMDVATSRGYTSSTAAPAAASPSGIVWLDAGDYLELYVGGGNVTASVDQSSPILSVAKIG